MNGEERASRGASRGKGFALRGRKSRGNSSAAGGGQEICRRERKRKSRTFEEAGLLGRTMRRTTTTAIAKQLDLFSKQRRQRLPRKMELLPPPVVTDRKNSRVPHETRP